LESSGSSIGTETGEAGWDGGLRGDRLEMEPIEKEEVVENRELELIRGGDSEVERVEVGFWDWVLGRGELPEVRESELMARVARLVAREEALEKRELAESGSHWGAVEKESWGSGEVGVLDLEVPVVLGSVTDLAVEGPGDPSDGVGDSSVDLVVRPESSWPPAVDGAVRCSRSLVLFTQSPGQRLIKHLRLPERSGVLRLIPISFASGQELVRKVAKETILTLPLKTVTL
jgi:hypothetical protein